MQIAKRYGRNAGGEGVTKVEKGYLTRYEIHQRHVSRVLAELVADYEQLKNAHCHDLLAAIKTSAECLHFFKTHVFRQD